MAHFLYKLIPPRPSFAEDMDETEARLMSGTPITGGDSSSGGRW